MPKRYILKLFLFLSIPLDAVATEYDHVLGKVGVNFELVSKINEHKGVFKSWMKEHEKSYETTEEEVKRLVTWIKNHEYIERHNSPENNSSYSLGHNHFSDLTNDEFRQFNFLGEYSPGIEGAFEMIEAADPETSVSRELKHKKYHLTDHVELAAQIDWVEHGAVTIPKNQGKCGACWAFSTTGAIEGARFLKTGELVSLSEQMLIDCDLVDKGCKGGLMQNAFKFDEIEGGICTETDYPYKATNTDNRKCNDRTCDEVTGTKVKSFRSVPLGNLDAMKTALMLQPVSIAISAHGLNFQLYHSGVFNDNRCSHKVDHGVLAVGYGTDGQSGLGYLKVKNSWGQKWGENGYFRINSYTDKSNHGDIGMCGILSKLSVYPVLE